MHSVKVCNTHYRVTKCARALKFTGKYSHVHRISLSKTSNFAVTWSYLLCSAKHRLSLLDLLEHSVSLTKWRISNVQRASLLPDHILSRAPSLGYPICRLWDELSDCRKPNKPHSIASTELCGQISQQFWNSTIWHVRLGRMLCSPSVSRLVLR